MSGIRTYPNKQAIETDPIFTGNIEQVVSVSTSKVPSSALFKTAKETLEASISAKADSSALTSGLAGKANTSHSHSISDVTNLQTTLDGKASSSHTHAQSDITNLTTDLSARELLANKSTNVLLGTSDTQYPTQNAVKTYVDNLITGLKWKQSVRVATTTNGTLTSAFANGQVVDDIALVTGDRILLKNQTTASQNGIYTVNSSGSPTRATDSDSNSELIAATVFVEQGTVNADTAWVCTNNSITIGSTSLVFAQVFGAGTFTAGTGLQLTGNQFSVDSTVTRQGNSFNGNSQLVQLNSSGQFPALDGRNLTNLPAPAINFTYGETITAGNLVELRSDGKVYKINGITISNNQTAAYNSVNTGMYYDDVNSRILAWGKDSSGNYKVKVGTISGTTITWGTAVDIYASTTTPAAFSICYNATQGCYVMAFPDSTAAGLDLRAFTVSGTTITMGTATNVASTGAVSNVTITSLSNSNVVVGYKGASLTNYIFRTVSISGTTLTANTAVDTGVALSNGVAIWNPAESRVYLGLGSVSGMTFLTTYSESSGILTQQAGSWSVGSSQSNLIVGSFCYNAKLGKICAFAITSNLISIYYLTPTTVSTSNDYVKADLLQVIPLIVSTSAPTSMWYANEKLMMCFIATSGSSNNQILLLVADYNTFKVVPLGWINTTATLSIGNNYIVGTVVRVSGQTRTFVAQNLNLLSYIGVANASGVANDSKEVLLADKIYTTTGLIAGANYYVQLDGSYSTNPTSLFLGKAISTTQLLLDI